MKFLTSASVVVAALAGVFVPGAAADPIRAPSSSTIVIICGSESTTLVMNGNGIFSPIHDVAGTSVLVPTSLNVTLTFTFSSGGPPAVDHAIISKAAPIQNTVSCDIPLQSLFTTVDTSATIEGTVTGFWTPQ